MKRMLRVGLLLLFLLGIRAYGAEIRLYPQMGDGLSPSGICLGVQRAAQPDGTLTEAFRETRIDLSDPDAAAFLAGSRESGIREEELVLTGSLGEGRKTVNEDGWYLITMVSKEYGMEPFLLRIPDEAGSRVVSAYPKLLSEEEAAENEASYSGGSAYGAAAGGQTAAADPVRTLDPTLLGNAWLLAGVSGLTVLFLCGVKRR